jgi:hypothetical protein
MNRRAKVPVPLIISRSAFPPRIVHHTVFASLPSAHFLHFRNAMVKLSTRAKKSPRKVFAFRGLSNANFAYDVAS